MAQLILNNKIQQFIEFLKDFTEVSKELYGSLTVVKKKRLKSYADSIGADVDDVQELNGNDFLAISLQLINLISTNVLQMCTTLSGMNFSTYQKFDKAYKFSYDEEFFRQFFEDIYRHLYNILKLIFCAINSANMPIDQNIQLIFSNVKNLTLLSLFLNKQKAFAQFFKLVCQSILTNDCQVDQKFCANTSIFFYIYDYFTDCLNVSCWEFMINYLQICNHLINKEEDNQKSTKSGSLNIKSSTTNQTNQTEAHTKPNQTEIDEESQQTQIQKLIERIKNFFRFTSSLRSKQLVYLITALESSTYDLLEDQESVPNQQRKQSEVGSTPLIQTTSSQVAITLNQMKRALDQAFTLNKLFEVVNSNKHRIHLIWKMISSILITISTCKKNDFRNKATTTLGQIIQEIISFISMGNPLALKEQVSVDQQSKNNLDSPLLRSPLLPEKEVDNNTFTPSEIQGILFSVWETLSLCQFEEVKYIISDQIEQVIQTLGTNINQKGRQSLLKVLSNFSELQNNDKYIENFQCLILIIQSENSAEQSVGDIEMYMKALQGFINNSGDDQIIYHSCQQFLKLFQHLNDHAKGQKSSFVNNEILNNCRDILYCLVQLSSHSNIEVREQSLDCFATALVEYSTNFETIFWTQIVYKDILFKLSSDTIRHLYHFLLESRQKKESLQQFMEWQGSSLQLIDTISEVTNKFLELIKNKKQTDNLHIIQESPHETLSESQIIQNITERSEHCALLKIDNPTIFQNSNYKSDDRKNRNVLDDNSDKSSEEEDVDCLTEKTSKTLQEYAPKLSSRQEENQQVLPSKVIELMNIKMSQNSFTELNVLNLEKKSKSAQNFDRQKYDDQTEDQDEEDDDHEDNNHPKEGEKENGENVIKLMSFEDKMLQTIEKENNSDNNSSDQQEVKEVIQNDALIYMNPIIYILEFPILNYQNPNFNIQIYKINEKHKKSQLNGEVDQIVCTEVKTEGDKKSKKINKKFRIKDDELDNKEEGDKKKKLNFPKKEGILKRKGKLRYSRSMKQLDDLEEEEEKKIKEEDLKIVFAPQRVDELKNEVEMLYRNITPLKKSVSSKFTVRNNSKSPKLDVKQEEKSKDSTPQNSVFFTFKQQQTSNSKEQNTNSQGHIATDQTEGSAKKQSDGSAKKNAQKALEFQAMYQFSFRDNNQGQFNADHQEKQISPIIMKENKHYNNNNNTPRLNGSEGLIDHNEKPTINILNSDSNSSEQKKEDRLRNNNIIPTHIESKQQKQTEVNCLELFFIILGDFISFKIPEITFLCIKEIAEFIKARGEYVQYLQQEIITIVDRLDDFYSQIPHDINESKKIIELGIPETLNLLEQILNIDKLQKKKEHEQMIATSMALYYKIIIFPNTVEQTYNNVLHTIKYSDDQQLTLRTKEHYSRAYLFALLKSSFQKMYQMYSSIEPQRECSNQQEISFKQKKNIIRDIFMIFQFLFIVSLISNMMLVISISGIHNLVRIALLFGMKLHKHSYLYLIFQLQIKLKLIQFFNQLQITLNKKLKIKVFLIILYYLTFSIQLDFKLSTFINIIAIQKLIEKFQINTKRVDFYFIQVRLQVYMKFKNIDKLQFKNDDDLMLYLDHDKTLLLFLLKSYALGEVKLEFDQVIDIGYLIHNFSMRKPNLQIEKVHLLEKFQAQSFSQFCLEALFQISNYIEGCSEQRLFNSQIFLPFFLSRAQTIFEKFIQTLDQKSNQAKEQTILYLIKYILTFFYKFTIRAQSKQFLHFLENLSNLNISPTTFKEFKDNQFYSSLPYRLKKIDNVLLNNSKGHIGYLMPQLTACINSNQQDVRELIKQIINTYNKKIGMYDFQ